MLLQVPGLAESSAAHRPLKSACGYVVGVRVVFDLLGELNELKKGA